MLFKLEHFSVFSRKKEMTALIDLEKSLRWIADAPENKHESYVRIEQSKPLDFFQAHDINTTASEARNPRSSVRFLDRTETVLKTAKTQSNCHNQRRVGNKLEVRMRISIPNHARTGDLTKLVPSSAVQEYFKRLLLTQL